MLQPPTSSSAVRRMSEATGTSFRYVSSHGSSDRATSSSVSSSPQTSMSPHARAASGASSRASARRVSAPCATASSASSGKTYGALVASTPVIRAAERPPFLRWTTVTPSPASRSSAATVAGSSDPSSTTTSSCCSCSCSDTSAVGSVSPSLKHGTTTATRSIRRSVAALAGHSGSSVTIAPVEATAARARAWSVVGAWSAIAVTACVIVGGLLRFVTLGHQSYEGDEAWTLRLLHQSFGGMLHGVSRQESTPPLYYVLAWISAHLFGFGEFAVRAPSAFAGTAMVALAYPTAFALLGRRWPAVAVAALTAVSPILVWYSQEARAYALYAFLCAASLLFFARTGAALTRTNAWSWAALSALAVATHYFAGFFVVAEVVLLLRRRGRAILGPVAAVGVVSALLVPLAVYQYGSAEKFRAITTGSLGWRVKEVALRFIFYNYNPARDLALAIAVAAAAVLAWRGARRPGGGRTALLIAIATVGIPLALAVLHIIDVFFFRNMLAAWLPFVIAVAAGFAGL